MGLIEWHSGEVDWPGSELRISAGDKRHHLQFLTRYHAYRPSYCCGERLAFITPQGNPGRVPRCQKCSRSNRNNVILLGGKDFQKFLVDEMAQAFGLNLAVASLWGLEIFMWAQEVGVFEDFERWEYYGLDEVRRSGHWHLCGCPLALPRLEAPKATALREGLFDVPGPAGQVSQRSFPLQPLGNL